MKTTQSLNPVVPRAAFGRKRVQAQLDEPRPTTNRASPTPPAACASAQRSFDTELWNRLLTMELDAPGVEMPMSKRCAAEHGWTDIETARAIQEYKRFLYLTQRAGFEVTPSRPVDLVWHEHLMHTRHYWGKLCKEILNNDLHHEPGTGGTEADERLMWQYVRTLDAYRQTFDSEPPADIWPTPQLSTSVEAGSRRQHRGESGCGGGGIGSAGCSSAGPGGGGDGGSCGGGCGGGGGGD